MPMGIKLLDNNDDAGGGCELERTTRLPNQEALSIKPGPKRVLCSENQKDSSEQQSFAQ